MARKILLADDSVTAQNMGRKILADAGYDVSTVNNGSAALKRITEIKPDLIVLDVYMPGYSGLEVCQRLKDAEETAHIPVLLTVGKLEPFKPEEARRVRADGHIVKPFEASELLTAITRLEDRMVPQQSEGARFGNEGGGRRFDNGAGTDNGWKSRLGFPSKKKKEEPEEVAAGGFRDFRKGKSKTGTGGAFAAKGTPETERGPEPGLERSPEPVPVPDIPRDITPEELDALSALAAKLEPAVSAPENIAPLADRMPGTTLETRSVGPVEAPAVAVAAIKAEPEGHAVEADAKVELAEEKTKVETPASAVEPAAVAAAAVEARSRVEIAVEHLETAPEGAAVDTRQQGIEPSADQHSENQHSEDQHPEAAVSAALLAQEPAPVDRNDEPIFAAPASAVKQAAEEKTDAKPAEAVAVPNVDAIETRPLADAVAAMDLDSQLEPSEVQDLRAGVLQAENAAQPVPVAENGQNIAAAEEPVPSDEELAQALRLLTPATGHVVAAVAPDGSMAAGSRWVAEPVALSRDEAAISLEEEMFRTFAAMPATMAGSEIEPIRISGVSAIAAAVENRLAAVGLAASASAFSGPGAERSSAEYGLPEHGLPEHDLPEPSSEIPSPEASAAAPSAVDSSVEAKAAVSNVTSRVVDGSEAEKLGPEKLAPEKLEAERGNSPAAAPTNASEEAPEEEAAAATFADAIGQDEIDATEEQNRESIRATTRAMARAVAEGKNQDSSSQVEGEESMRKDVKSRSQKSNGDQVRSAMAGAAASSGAVEPAEAPKAMAATAAAEGSPSSSSSPGATDASAIASIVDSVMADLRPKIVEEIAKRLAGK